MTQFTNVEKLRCVERELALRRRVYARWVKAGSMSLAKATAEIKMMDEIASEYRERVLQEPTLFGGIAR